MVTTRTGSKLDRLVRFKKAVSVRKFLDFNSPSNWDLTPDNSDTDDTENNHCSHETSNDTSNRIDNGIQVSRHAANGLSTRLSGHCKSKPSDSSPGYDIQSNQTILYDDNSAFSIASVIWDAIVFVAFTLICYTIATFSYEYLGYSIYLVGCTLGLVCFHSTITYFDSAEPGVMPPSPMSPSKFRQASGHTFHLSYVMSLLCGVVFLICNVWLVPSSDIPAV